MPTPGSSPTIAQDWREEIRWSLAWKMLSSASRQKWEQEFLAPGSYLQRCEVARGLFVLLMREQLDYFFTLNLRTPRIDYDIGRAVMKQFGAKLDRLFLGSKWASQPPELRSFWLAVPEEDSSLHYHVGVTVRGDRRRLDDLPPWALGRALQDQLKKVKYVNPETGRKRWLCPTVDIYGQAVSDDELHKLAAYTTKRAYTENSIENFVLASEFWPVL